MALPRFSRNYGRSGAYENPAVVVDTKTAEIWANTIDNLGKMAAIKLAEEKKAEAARVKEAQDRIAFGYESNKKNSEKVYSLIGKSGLNNPDLVDFADKQIDRLTQIDIAMYKQSDPSALAKANKLYNEEYNKVINMKNVIGLMKEGDAGFQARMADDDAVLSAGKPGGLALYEDKDQQYLYGYMQRSGLGNGATETFYENEDGVMMVEYKGGIIPGNGFKAVAAEFFSYIPYTVPNDKEDLEERFKAKNLLTENGTINPAYRVRENGEDVTESQIDPKTQSIVTYSPLNTNQIAGVASITTDQLAASRLMTNDAQNSYTQSIRPYLVGKGISYKDGKDWPEELTIGDGTFGNSPYDDKSQILYKEALATYAKDLFGLNKTNQEVSRTKLSDSEYKRRMGITDDEDSSEKLTATERTQRSVEERAKKRVDAILSNPSEAVRAVIGEEGYTEAKNAEGEVIITLYPGTEDEDKFNMNRSNQVARLAKRLEEGEFGKDQTTDKVIFEIDRYIEERRKKRLP